MKLCSTCRQVKEFANFHINTKYSDGYKCECKQCCKERFALWSKNNINKRLEYKKQYFQKNKVKLSNALRARRNAFLDVKLQSYLRTRLYLAIKNNQKVGSAVKDLGCSVEELKKFIESQFQPGMSWDNWSHNGWHIDHKIPLSKFDLTRKDQMLQAVHYTNLQPLWAFDNFSKGNRYEQI